MAQLFPNTDGWEADKTGGGDSIKEGGRTTEGARLDLAVLAVAGILLGGGAAHGGRVPLVALAHAAHHHRNALPPHLLEQPAPHPQKNQIHACTVLACMEAT
jgi:hypothetical protein